jgi:hypothetical protein
VQRRSGRWRSAGRVCGGNRVDEMTFECTHGERRRGVPSRRDPVGALRWRRDVGRHGCRGGIADARGVGVVLGGRPQQVGRVDVAELDEQLGDVSERGPALYPVAGLSPVLEQVEVLAQRLVAPPGPARRRARPAFS